MKFSRGEAESLPGLGSGGTLWTSASVVSFCDAGTSVTNMASRRRNTSAAVGCTNFVSGARVDVLIPRRHKVCFNAVMRLLLQNGRRESSMCCLNAVCSCSGGRSAVAIAVVFVKLCDCRNTSGSSGTNKRATEDHGGIMSFSITIDQVCCVSGNSGGLLLSLHGRHPCATSSVKHASSSPPNNTKGSSMVSTLFGRD